MTDPEASHLSVLPEVFTGYQNTFETTPSSEGYWPKNQCSNWMLKVQNVYFTKEEDFTFH